MFFRNRDRGRQFHARFPHHCEQAFHEDGRFSGFNLPDVALGGAKFCRQFTLGQAAQEPGLLKDSAERLRVPDFARVFHSQPPDYVTVVSLVDYVIVVKQGNYHMVVMSKGGSWPVPRMPCRRSVCRRQQPRHRRQPPVSSWATPMAASTSWP